MKKKNLLLNRVGILMRLFVLLTLVGTLGRIVFFAVYKNLITEGGQVSFDGMAYHGLRLDIAVAGYFCCVPLLLLLTSVWCMANKALGKCLNVMWNVYMLLVSIAFAIAFIANIGLYGYWGFPLDSTPLGYLMSSPKETMASATFLQLAGGLVGLVVVSGLLFYFLGWTRICPNMKVLVTKKEKRTSSAVLLLMGALLFVAIRGGINTVATNNVGSVYFSDNIRLNHAAVNPVFSFLESVTHDNDFGSQYRFMPDSEADAVFAPMTYTKLREPNEYDVKDTLGTRVIVVVLESFSKYIMGESGNVEGITPNLDKLSKDGLYFTNFYANSFRTDRGLASILCGYPAQPAMSIAKYPRLTRNLYSIAHSLAKDGFSTHYLYGGDANFAHKRSFLKDTGYEKIITSADFADSEVTSKWGAHDGALFKKALNFLDNECTPENKTFTVIQTLSSHEPFDVPYHKLENEQLNAFQYTDCELGKFVAELKKRPDWNNTLLVVVPDHLGCYPPDIDHYSAARYQIPLIITGGMVKQARRINTYASQQDIAATLLAMLGLSHDEFTFSKDILDPKAPHFAFFTYPDAVGMVNEENGMMIDNQSGRILFNTGIKPGANEMKAKAYLQKVFDDLASR